LTILDCVAQKKRLQDSVSRKVRKGKFAKGAMIAYSTFKCSWKIWVLVISLRVDKQQRLQGKNIHKEIEKSTS